MPYQVKKEIEETGVRLFTSIVHDPFWRNMAGSGSPWNSTNTSCSSSSISNCKMSNTTQRANNFHLLPLTLYSHGAKTCT